MTAETMSPPRALRGLVFGLLLSAVNLLGAFLTIAALGGLGPWSASQFIGLFALLEVATGIGFIVGPNIWHLPVVQGQTDTPVRLAASSILRPHWAAGAKGLAGLALLAATAHQTGIGTPSIGLLLIIVDVLACVVGLSLLAARIGVARPDLDVYQFVVRRPRHPEKILPSLSLSASAVQLVINIGAFPAVKVWGPGIMYQPEFGPSAGTVVVCSVAGAASLVCGFAAWMGRLSLRAPRPQERVEQRLEQEPARSR